MTLHGIRILLQRIMISMRRSPWNFWGAQGADIQRVENGKLAGNVLKQHSRRISGNSYGHPDAADERAECNKKPSGSLERPDAQTIPIIAMTANSFQEDVDAALAAEYVWLCIKAGGYRRPVP